MKRGLTPPFFIFIGMVINVTTDYPLIVFTGNLPAYSSYMMRLVSRYSDLPINNNFRDINLNEVSRGNNWFLMIATTSMYDLKEKEISGYYDCILIGKDALDREYTISTTLCKVLNNLDALPNNYNVEYNSNNDENQQFIWFNNEL